MYTFAYNSDTPSMRGTNSQTPRLPIELVEDIISFLPKIELGLGSSRDFRMLDELYNFALAGPDFLHSSRRRLFSRIIFLRHEDVRRVVELAQQPRMGPLLSYVRELQIVG